VHDNEVKEDEKPPEMSKLEETRIGTMNQEGMKDNDIVAPPVDDGDRGVVVAPQKEEEDWNKTWTKVEIPSEYPGGLAAWQRFLNRNLRPNDELEGTVEVQFIVDKDGNVSEVQALTGPEELRREAERVIKKSGKWTPAIQNGHQVKSLKKQPIIFRLEAQE
jgi:protein TonB